MSVRPITHFVWQLLRTAKRSPVPATGKRLRVVPTRQTKDGSFLAALVEEGLLVRVTGSAARPFEATYALTPLGEHAAEYGEYDHATKPTEPTAEVTPKPTALKARKRSK